MPIKPENVGRYPKDWKAIRERILARAGNCCEGSPAFPSCRIPNGAFRVKEVAGLAGECWTRNEDEAYAMATEAAAVTRIVLTIGHLDHTPENCADENLRAWCQRCHLQYDARHHAQTAYQTRRQGRALAELFDDCQ